MIFRFDGQLHGFAQLILPLCFWEPKSTQRVDCLIGSQLQSLPAVGGDPGSV